MPTRVVPDAGRPLSFAQQRLWFIHQVKPESAVYNIPFAYRVAGALDAGVLDRALREVARRHEALRTTFASVDGTPVQFVGPSDAIGVEVVDLRGVADADAREREGRRLCEEEARRPFDLERGPLVRARLVRLDAEDHLLVLNFHHIVFDGWSIGVLATELATLYEAFAEGRPSPLPELPIQYADFATRQRAWLQGENLDRQLAYWRRQLDGVRVLDLPTDRPRPRMPSFRGAKHKFAFPPELSRALVQLARRESVTPFMLLLTAFQGLLHRYTGQPDIAVGTPIAGRTQRETEGLIGFFVNTLVLRADLSDDPTFRELLGRVRETCLDAYAHQDVPFERLVEELAPERDLSRPPLFQVMFTLQNMPVKGFRLGGTTLAPQHPDTGSARVDLTLLVEETPQGFSGKVEYSTDLFDEGTVAAMLGHLRAILDAVARDPDRRVSDLPLLTEAERQRLHAWNDTRREYPRDASLHALFEAQARRSPDQLAIEFGAERLTYRQLDEKANRLAHRLSALGVSRDVLVGLCVERAADMIVGMLGILKAGGAYVPLDPSYPRERLRFMIEDARAPVVLTQARLRDRIPEGDARVLSLDEDWAREVAALPATPPQDDSAATDLAYVMYTSGSTGVPKGVAVPHRAISRLVFDTSYVRVGPSDRVAQASNASFDAATFEIWTPLLHGAQLVGLEKESLLTAQGLRERLERDAITTLFVTPALLNQLVREAPDVFKGLNNLVVGGDAFDPRRAAEILAAGPPRHLVNGYGPTETTTFASSYEIRDVPPGAASIPIGRPIANTTLHVLDARMRPVPVGVRGELYIGGDGLARGYHARPELTAERFVAWNGERLYRTGDLARWRADGNVEFLGRVDHQVKIRGFRIEPGEVEAVVSRHPAVKEALVLVREDEPGEKRLVAYAAPATLDPAEVKEFLRARLPGHMVPAAIVPLDAFPLTPNGKVDRKALPRPEEARPSVARAHEAPRTELEQVIAGVWAELLGVERVGLHDNFFDLGGHSLLIPQLQSRVAQALRRELPVVAFFEHTTVAALARHLAAEEPAAPVLQSRIGRGEARRAMRQRRQQGRAPSAAAVEEVGDDE